MTMSTCVVHVIDDDAAWRTSAQRLLTVVGYRVALYDSAENFLETADWEDPGCVLLDLRMPGLSGPQLQERLSAKRRQLPIIFISGHGDIATSVRVMKSGARDFLTKPVDTAALLTAVADAVARDRANRAERDRRDAWRACVDGLTPTERRVLDLVVQGKLNKQVAAELGTAERTIKWHRHNIMDKLQVRSLAELVSIAERLGLVGGR